MGPAFLYHGTSERHLARIMAEGLKPRGAHGRTNWRRTVESNPSAVYLTDAYPLLFAMNCARPGERLAVVQLETAALDDGNLVPDEDVLEQSGRGRDDVAGAMRKRTRHYRAKLPEFRFTEKWQASLRGMGTCGYLGSIDPGAISRVALVDRSKAPTLALAAVDAFVSLANYRFCQAKYRNLTNRLFGLETEPDPLEHGFGASALDNPALADIHPIIRAKLDYEAALAEEYAAAVHVLDVKGARNG